VISRNFAHVQYLLGQAYIMTGDSQLARESFERAVALQPGWSRRD
jgi:Tfp pilus assembly protein PilF